MVRLTRTRITPREWHGLLLSRQACCVPQACRRGRQEPCFAPGCHHLHLCIRIGGWLASLIVYTIQMSCRTRPCPPLLTYFYRTQEWTGPQECVFFFLGCGFRRTGPNAHRSINNAILYQKHPGPPKSTRAHLTKLVGRRGQQKALSC